MKVAVYHRSLSLGESDLRGCVTRSLHELSNIPPKYMISISSTSQLPNANATDQLRIWYQLLDSSSGSAFKASSMSSTQVVLSSPLLLVEDLKKQIHREQRPLLGMKFIWN